MSSPGSGSTSKRTLKELKRVLSQKLGGGRSRSARVMQAALNVASRKPRRARRSLKRDYVPRSVSGTYRFHASSLFRSYPLLHT